MIKHILVIHLGEKATGPAFNHKIISLFCWFYFYIVSDPLNFNVDPDPCIHLRDLAPR